MKLLTKLYVVLVAGMMLFGGAGISLSYAFKDRVVPGVMLGDIKLIGVRETDLVKLVGEYELQFEKQMGQFVLGDEVSQLKLEEIGVKLDREKVADKLKQLSLAQMGITKRTTVDLEIIVDTKRLREVLSESIKEFVNEPINADIKEDSDGNFQIVASMPGETIDFEEVIAALKRKAQKNSWKEAIELKVKVAEAEVTENEVGKALEYGQEIARNGLRLVYEDQVIEMNPYNVKKLVQFVEQVDPNDKKNHILGIKFEPIALREYLDTTVAPAVYTEAVDARFSVSRDEEGKVRVQQFAIPDRGRSLNINGTVNNFASRLARFEKIIPLNVDITEPNISKIDELEDYGLTTLLATGESDFVGSPLNRKHNIAVGAARYHGLLVPPQSEFSFNNFLGPVNASAGFKPELVIKNNVTTPEFGGGLCQVSTTAFRAALNAGLEITQRRNHSYAVSYYGIPGLDATIYPPYTDLRFLNNTPGYILIQTRIEGTKLFFEFWGTDDKRQVEIVGPVTYDRLANGAVKAYVEQKVMLGGETIIDETFYSRYKSPRLFPRVLAANGEAGPDKEINEEDKNED